MSLALRVKERRNELNITQTELAERLGCKNKSTVCRIEKGIDTNLTKDRLDKLSNALNTSVSYLMELTDDPTPCSLLDSEAIMRGRRDGAILRIISQLNDKNAELIKEFALTLLNSQD